MVTPQREDDVPDYDADEDHEALSQSAEDAWDDWENELREAAKAFGVPPS